MLSRRTKSAKRESEKGASGSAEEEASNEAAVDNEKSNRDCEVSEEIAQEEPCNIPEEPVKITEGKVQGKLKPPRVLEVL